MVKVSVVVLTKNEQEKIRDCLLSVKAWADEIVVVDDESSDNTVSITREFTDRVLVRKMDIEGRHRNWAYSQVGNDWVLSLDADERVTEELKREIELVLKEPKDFNGFTIPRKNFIGQTWVKSSGWYPSPQLKLFRKDKFRYEEVGVHPRAFMSEPCGHLKSNIIHYSYKDIEDFISKLNRQTTLEAEKWYRQGKPMRLGHFLWRSLDRFMRSFIGKKGFKDGFWGFVVAFHASLYQFLSYLKYREIKREQDLVNDK